MSKPTHALHSRSLIEDGATWTLQTFRDGSPIRATVDPDGSFVFEAKFSLMFHDEAEYCFKPL